MQRQQQQQRIAFFRDRISVPVNAMRYVNWEPTASLAGIATPTGLCFDSKGKDEELRKYWLGVAGEKKDAERVAAGVAVPRWKAPTMTREHIFSVRNLRTVVMRMHTGSSPGPTSWHPSDLKLSYQTLPLKNWASHD